MKTVYLHDLKNLAAKASEIYIDEATKLSDRELLAAIGFGDINHLFSECGQKVTQASLRVERKLAKQGYLHNPGTVALARNDSLFGLVCMRIFDVVWTPEYNLLSSSLFVRLLNKTSKEHLKEFTVEHTEDNYRIVGKWLNEDQLRDVFNGRSTAIFLAPNAIDYLRNPSRFRHPAEPETMRPMIERLVKFLHTQNIRVFTVV